MIDQATFRKKAGGVTVFAILALIAVCLFIATIVMQVIEFNHY